MACMEDLVPTQTFTPNPMTLSKDRWQDTQRDPEQLLERLDRRVEFFDPGPQPARRDQIRLRVGPAQWHPKPVHAVRAPVHWLDHMWQSTESPYHGGLVDKSLYAGGWSVKLSPGPEDPVVVLRDLSTCCSRLKSGSFRCSKPPRPGGPAPNTKRIWSLSTNSQAR